MYHEIRRGFYASLPLMLGFTPLAMILGAQAHQQGQTALTAYLMTAINLAGGSEFAAVSLWQHPVPPILLIVLSTFLINSRHIILGASLAPYIKQESGLRIFFLYFVMCDETWALSMQETQRRVEANQGFNFVYHMSVGVCLWANWSISAFLGALIGAEVGDLNSLGFSIALPATFIGLTVAMRPKKEYIKYLPIVVSFAASALCAVYIDTTYSVGAGALAGLLTAYFIQVIKEKNDPKGNDNELKVVPLREDEKSSNLNDVSPQSETSSEPNQEPSPAKAYKTQDATLNESTDACYNPPSKGLNQDARFNVKPDITYEGANAPFSNDVSDKPHGVNHDNGLSHAKDVSHSQDEPSSSQYSGYDEAPSRRSSAPLLLKRLADSKEESLSLAFATTGERPPTD